ncbi:hypothetical protein MMC07_001161 [Pseudocyphellaria aurata]|nr:hypothetical protein [Pseudocyphellaria aurata]
MHKTLLLCFIHGFKGGDDTFGGFPDHIRALVSHALPKLSVKAVTYPKYETRGDLTECVERFREWLQNVVIDLEISASTASPTIDPSVRTVLIGHSMGGIVAAETLFSITSDAPIPVSNFGSFPQSPELSSETCESFMFPYIQGILAFDTPYLGISPSVIAHGAETHYKTASSAYSAFTEVASVFGYGAASKSPPPSSSPGKRPKALLPAPDSAKDALAASTAAKDPDTAAAPAWQRWGKYAAFAAGAVAAGGAAAYFKGDTITEGWSWVGSHLEFVGCLARAEELKTRLERMVRIQDDKGVGFKDLVTVLGRGAQGQSMTAGYLEINGPAEARERTFCTIPRSERNRRAFEKVVIVNAANETEAHMSMFFPRENLGYYSMSERAKELVVSWVEKEWYEGSNAVEDGERGLAVRQEFGVGV